MTETTCRSCDPTPVHAHACSIVGKHLYKGPYKLLQQPHDNHMQVMCKQRFHAMQGLGSQIVETVCTIEIVENCLTDWICLCYAAKLAIQYQVTNGITVISWQLYVRYGFCLLQTSGYTELTLRCCAGGCLGTRLFSIM